MEDASVEDIAQDDSDGEGSEVVRRAAEAAFFAGCGFQELSWSSNANSSCGEGDRVCSR